VADNSRPFEARTAYLNGKSAEDKAAILERASRQGPGPQDADWVVAKACDDAAQRIEAAAGSMSEKALADFAERLERVEQGVDNLGKQKPAAVPVPAVPAIPVELTTQLGRIETKLSGLRTANDTFQLAGYLGCFIFGMMVVLWGSHFVLGSRVPVQWLILSAGAFGAAAVVLVAVVVVRVHSIFEDRRWIR
jgi:hypothetical protein